MLVEGWRGINHSYALANQYQLVEFSKREDLRLFHVDAPFARADWSRQRNPPGFTLAQQRAIDAIPPPGNEAIDCVYAISSPFAPASRRARTRAVTFMITETGLDTDAFVPGNIDVEAYTRGQNLVQTSSRWSRDRLADWGIRHDGIAVIPLGVDAETFAPMNADDRAMSRATLGAQPDEILFFAVAAPFFNKGLDLLLRAFAILVHKGRNVRLIVKDQKDVYNRSAEDIIQTLAPRHPGLFSTDVVARMSFVHGNVSREILRIFYCAADCVVSAYRAEGFNLPILEAISCGTPVIVTAGGATDDFVSTEVAVTVPGSFMRIDETRKGLVGAYIEPDFDALVDSMDLFASERAPLSGRQAAGREIARRFSWPATAATLVETLKNGTSV